MNTAEFIRDQVDCRTFLEKSLGVGMFCCPFCGSGRGPHRTGALRYYADSKFFYCHACGAKGDVIELYKQLKGCDFKTALRDLTAQLGTAVELADTKPTRGRSLASSQVRSAPPQSKDLSEYFAECRERLCTPAAIAYLTGRGISLETAERCGLGYDPRADPAGSHRCCARIIVPTNHFHFVARSIDPDAQPGSRTMNNRGATPDLFNRQALYAPGGEPVFVTEGCFDALSIIEVGGSAIALNSASNGRLLLDALRERPTNHPLLLCLDSDRSGREACANLAEQLHADGVVFRDVCADICGTFKDPNDALQADRNAFFKAVQRLKTEMIGGNNNGKP